jgi:hypothetical protein
MNMEIQVRTKCKECDGCGFLSNSFYEELHKVQNEYREKNGERMTIEQEDEWRSEQGYSEWPTEEYVCDNCGGTGKEIKWIPIEEALSSVRSNAL